MATKKSTKSKIKPKTAKATYSPVNASYCGKCFVALALIITMILFGLFYYMGRSKTSLEAQEVQAFRSLAESYINEKFSIDGVQSATTTNVGVTKDKDLYVDFVITKYEDHVPTARQNARLHFQCNNNQTNITSSNCAHAYSYDDWVEVSEEEK